MKVYISGAITGLPLEQAREAFGSAARTLRVMGHEPCNPFDVPPHHGCRCEHATDSQDGAGGNHDWGCYLRADLAALLDCDAIYMLYGWESSHGARLELQVAAAVGLKVYWSSVVPVHYRSDRRCTR